MSVFAENYFRSLQESAGAVRVTDQSGNPVVYADGVDRVIELIRAMPEGRKLIFIGNGGSAAISSHMSTDFWKNGGMRAVAFNDSSLLTCIGNDYGYKHVFEKPVEMFADRGDLLIAISSSGQSENILLGVKAARARGCAVVTLSGFKSDNPLSAMGDCNFYVPSSAYGTVEVLHHAICHCLLDTIMHLKHG